MRDVLAYACRHGAVPVPSVIRGRVMPYECAVGSQPRKLTAMQAPIARRPRHFSDLMAANHQGRS